MSPSEIPPEADFKQTLDTFLKWKILGDKLGFCWQVDEVACSPDRSKHYDNPVVSVAIKSYKPTVRRVEIDFEAHEMLFSEHWEDGVDEQNYREKWANKLIKDSIVEDQDEAEKAVLLLERNAIESVAGSQQDLVNDARKRGKSPFWAIQEASETKRSIKIPGGWLTELKKREWPSRKD